MAFFNCEFPRALAYLAMGGDAFFTSVNIGYGGHEQRQRNWRYTRKKWKVALDHVKQDVYDTLHPFFLVVGGQADAFRLYDPADHSVTGSPLGTVPTPGVPSVVALGDGATTQFQLLRQYSSGGRTYLRVVTKPIMATVTDYKGNSLTNTVKIYKSAVLQTITTDYTIDATTGIVTFTSAPTVSAPLTWDGDFHIPVRFNADEEQWQIDPSPKQGVALGRRYSWQGLELWEVRPPNS